MWNPFILFKVKKRKENCLHLYSKQKKYQNTKTEWEVNFCFYLFAKFLKFTDGRIQRPGNSWLRRDQSLVLEYNPLGVGVIWIFPLPLTELRLKLAWRGKSGKLTWPWFVHLFHKMLKRHWEQTSDSGLACPYFGGSSYGAASPESSACNGGKMRSAKMEPNNWIADFTAKTYKNEFEPED